jgi:hypothetical protein
MFAKGVTSTLTVLSLWMMTLVNWSDVSEQRLTIFGIGMGLANLIDLEINGKLTKALIRANRTGYFYVLDRADGKFLYAKTYCEVT